MFRSNRRIPVKTVGNIPRTGNGWRFIKYTSSTEMPSSVRPIRRQRRRTCKRIFDYGNNSSQDQWKHYSILRPRVAITANSADPAGLSSIPNVLLICPFLQSQEAHFLEAGWKMSAAPVCHPPAEILKYLAAAEG